MKAASTLLGNGLRDAVHQILQHATAFDWSLQGLGMLRMYLSREVRLHVWDGRFAVPDASIIHTHPWDFESRVISGEVRQFRYSENNGVHTHKRQAILCGPSGCADGEPVLVSLGREPLETYGTGTSYTQFAAEIHESLPTPGTVTVVERTFHEDTEHAFVYYQGETWVEATPRPATLDEVTAITSLALRRWGRAA